MRLHPCLLLVFALLMACSGDTPTTPVDGALGFETVVKASSSGFFEPTRTTVRSAAEWADAWQTLHAGQNPAPAVPAVDFDRTVVVIAAAGTRSNGCYAIEITGAALQGSGSIAYEVTETVPGPACVCTQALTQPVHVVKVARLPNPETFIERRTERQC